MLSLSILLGIENDAKKLITKNGKIIESDRLLSYLSSYIENGKAVWDSAIPITKEYAEIETVIESSNKNEAMAKYLVDWYANHSGFAWFDSHLRDTDTYCGYWSFEAAAVAKILCIDESVLRGMEYYPSL